MKINFNLLIVIIFIFLLRLPTLFEPYWYGDEGIYLAIGQALNRGAVMYRDIWDNKTPLLYYIYAINPTLIWAKLTGTMFVLGTTAGVYALVKNLFFSYKSFAKELISISTSLLAGIFLSIPLFEGTIANAELYFTLPTVWAAYLLQKSISSQVELHKKNYFLGVLISLAFLIKVPAIFDFLGILFAWCVIFIKEHYKGLSIGKIIFKLLTSLCPILATFLLVFIGINIYFFTQNALVDFYTAVFFQNSSYVAIDSGPLSNITNPLFIKGFVLLVSSAILMGLFFYNKIRKDLLMLILWFCFSLYGALLSNRAYMHYLLQIVPPTIILLTYLFITYKRNWMLIIPTMVILSLLHGQFKNAFFLSPQSYYQNWFDYISERKSWSSYVTYFDYRTLNSYKIAAFISENTQPSDQIFVWADASFVYVLSQRPPATKFIQAHHLSTIDPKNYDLIIRDLADARVKYILISKPIKFEFPKLEELLINKYRHVQTFADMFVYEHKEELIPNKVN